MTGLATPLRAIVREVALEPAGGVRLGPQRLDWVGGVLEGEWRDDPRSLAVLGSVLYRHYHLRTDVTRAPPRIRSSDSHEHGALVELLARANAWTSSPSPGWRVGAVHGRQARVERGGVTLHCTLDELAPSDPAEGTRAGGIVTLRLPSARPRRSPGYFLMVGPEGPPAPRASTVRVYARARLTHAPALVSRITRGIAERALPAVLKVANHPTAFDRADSVVLYLERRGFAACVDLLEGLLDGEPFEPGPLSSFVRPWRERLGIACERLEGRTTPVSFGETRSRAVARGLLEAHCAGAANAAAVEERVVSCLLEAHVDPQRPHLDLGEEDLPC